MSKLKFIVIVAVLLVVALVYLYFIYFFTYEQRNVVKRKVGTVTGQNMTVTVYGLDGKILKSWQKVQKITSGADDKNYTYFYTKDNKYVQIPDSVWYIAEEE